MIAVGILLAMMAMTALIFTHGCPAFLISIGLFSGGIINPHVVSIAALYSPRRAARLHLAR